MAPPLYFFPAITLDQLCPAGELDREILRAADLDATLADVHKADCSVFELAGVGPGGHSGTILCALPTHQKAPTRLGFYPDFQDWSEFKGVADAEQQAADEQAAGRLLPPVRFSLFVGIDKEHPPTPECLARKRQIPGYELELAGGRWTVPVIRDPKNASALPSRWTYSFEGPNRKAKTTLREEYRAVWESWGPVVQLFFDPEGAPEVAMDIQDALDRCVQVLALNYRVGPHEQCLLDLVGPETWDTILAASVDLPAFRDVYEQVHQQRLAGHRREEKKTEAHTEASTTTSPAGGKGASGPSTPVVPDATPSAAPAAGSPGAEVS